MGSKAIDEFSEERGLQSEESEMSDDHFYTIIESPSSATAQVRDGVITWVNKLHKHDKCSASIYELLDLIMTQLLVVDPRLRISGRRLCHELNELVKESEKNRGYLLQPVPWQPILPVTSTPAEKTPFSSNRGVDTPVISQSRPRDLVGRAAGTVGLDRQQSMSWQFTSLKLDPLCRESPGYGP